jgi:hypothetical protein
MSLSKDSEADMPRWKALLLTEDNVQRVRETPCFKHISATAGLRRNISWAWYDDCVSIHMVSVKD